MAVTWKILGAVSAGALAAYACSSSSSGSGQNGGVTTSCTVGGSLCTQIVVPSSGVSGEQQSCGMQMGTFASAPCPTAGSLGCCLNPAVQEEQCAYDAPTAQVGQMICAQQGRTWVGADGGVIPGDSGVSGAAAFVGTWGRSGTQTVMCPNGTTMVNISGDLVITLGSASNTITGTAPDGCTTNYSVSGNVATATAGQTCNVTTEAGVAETLTVTSRTFTLSTDGTSMMVMGTETIDKTATMTMCTATSTGVYTKQ